LADLQLETLSKVRVPGIVLFGVAAAMAAFLAVRSTPWWWLICGAFAAASFFYWWWPKRVRQRVERLMGGLPRH
jgi:hypothetical protein